ncbi:DNA topoisomerase 2-binding protein 1 [Borealophlyctis nickersoniae]|nr:DNA topoisomerase 2-binding protein 1 [Borealophlyctis nickersoniae]
MEVTHLVADTAQTEKYKAASKLSIPIVTTEWIHECWERRDEDGFDPDKAAEDHLMKPFSNLEICVTGYDVGKKYEFAVKWKIHIMDMKWIRDSVQMNACANEALYRLVSADENNAPGAETDTAASNPSRKSANAVRVTTSFMHSAYLDRCNVFLGEGFSQESIQHLRKIVRDGGGSLPKTFDGFVTHFIVSAKGPTAGDLRLVRSSSSQPTIVRHQWLRECYRERTSFPVDEYLVQLPDDDGIDIQMIEAGDGTAGATDSRRESGRQSRSRTTSSEKSSERNVKPSRPEFGEKVTVREDRKNSNSNFGVSDFWDELLGDTRSGAGKEKHVLTRGGTFNSVATDVSQSLARRTSSCSTGNGSRLSTAVVSNPVTAATATASKPGEPEWKKFGKAPAVPQGSGSSAAGHDGRTSFCEASRSGHIAATSEG